MENHVANGDAHISHRLVRVANSQLTMENQVANGDGPISDRFIHLNGLRDDRRHMSRERVLLQQLQAFHRELQGLQESVLMTRTLALINALTAIVEQRIHAYGRLAADTGRIAGLVMDYLGDVMHI
ncbi:hypothetical protein CTI12_AA456520 [Artemisia annua]|uniref:Uncharacterized protein n=1 Tax=Artemisia annua TaxID=35608 RepID=A0A2U1L1I5_ARTAN|nr:hypothetical protein CTI12_AA456520 [Artemisia annua]